jgi:Phosphodiester glycosidase
MPTTSTSDKPKKKATRLAIIAIIGWLSCVFVLIIGGIGGWFYQHRQAEPTKSALRPQPAPTITQLYPGVLYERRVTKSPRPVVFHIIRIDLTTPGLRFFTTPGNQAKEHAKLPFPAKKTSQFLKDYGCQIAINGDFFYPCKINNPKDYYPHDGDFVTPEGDAISQGTIYATRDPHDWTTTLSITKDNHISIGTLLPPTPYNAIGGHALNLINFAKNTEKQTNPRTIVAHDATRKILYFVIIDGRQRGYSEGLTGEETARFVQALGATEAMLLDGGGSTVLVQEDTQDKSGFRVLNSPIDCHIPSRERAVANHLGVFVEK